MLQLDFGSSCETSWRLQQDQGSSSRLRQDHGSSWRLQQDQGSSSRPQWDQTFSGSPWQDQAAVSSFQLEKVSSGSLQQDLTSPVKRSSRRERHQGSSQVPAGDGLQQAAAQQAPAGKNFIRQDQGAFNSFQPEDVSHRILQQDQMAYTSNRQSLTHVRNSKREGGTVDKEVQGGVARSKEVQSRVERSKEVQGGGGEEQEGAGCDGEEQELRAGDEAEGLVEGLVYPALMILL